MPQYADYSDKELSFLLRQGDELAYAEIYDRFKGLLFVHAYKRLNNQEEAEDVLHDLFAALWDRRMELPIETNLPAYLYTAVRNRIFKIIAHKKITTAYLAQSQKTDVKEYGATDHLVRIKAGF
ncbi:hypothetical protein FMM05_13165 [Flavobacterium zepuense]|uniref:RNA polymerase sigma-70 region 2 domain-containing protein n=1 Tax=Flavobacterium zepuense TaxID=2593302 RepID=A0A552UZG0_9FLAO|nr:sigma factor [Flavobacterium zepuense]TRW23605.1 hypothetical protein FMM05_13165 [Flavobacterium zepuense]